MTKGPTPAMRQYYEMKEKHPDAILFLQMGDFFETFGEDAEVVSRELDITLTARGRTKDGERMPLAGVPIHAGEAYITRLVRKGYRVAVCEQVEDPKTAKGVVKREVVRVITPGTVIDPGMLTSNRPSYLMAVAPDRKRRVYGLAFLDITTGEFFVFECDADKGGAELSSAVARHHPSECIVPQGLEVELGAGLEANGIMVTPFRHSAFDKKEATEVLTRHFGVHSLEGFGCAGMDAAIAAAGACLHYARETQKTELSHINRLATRVSSERMLLDAITLRNLEITQSIRGGGDSTLMHVLNRTETPMGSRALQEALISPLLDRKAIEERLDAVEYFVTHVIVRNAVQSLLHRFADIERIAGRISYGNAGPRDLVSLAASLERIPEIRDTIETDVSTPPALVKRALAGMDNPGRVVDIIQRAIVDEPPVLARNGGVIREGWSDELDTLRQVASSGKNWIAEFQATERERTGIKSLKVGYTRVFGYFIEVTKANLHLVPPEYERKQTTANGERFTIPELKEKEALIANAEERLSAIETDLYRDLIACLKKEVTLLQQIARRIGEIDLLSALADAAQRNRYTRPALHDDERLVIREGRHPVVEQALTNSFVPNDTELDTRAEQILIITGANMAGKSTYMRAVALTCIMAQMGSFVPATHASVGIVDRIFTRVGAFDDLASGQSTFMVEMIELANILNNVTNKSLVILDEIGRGTSTLDGYSIAKSVLEFLHGKSSAGPRTLFATHFHELVGIENELKRVHNYHFAVKDTGTDVVFLRRIIAGATDRSYGIHVARLAGIPQKVTIRAEEILKQSMDREYLIGANRAPRYTQMLLIDSPELQSRDDEIVEQLRGVDLNTLTPIDALTTLQRLQKKANGEE